MTKQQEPWCGWQYMMEHNCQNCKIGRKCQFNEEIDIIDNFKIPKPKDEDR